MRSILRHLPNSPAVRYLGALAAVCMAFVVREVITYAAGPDFSEYVVFYPTVMIVALLAGLGPGMFAVGSAAAVLAALRFLPWKVLPFSPRTSNLVSLGFFVGVCAFLTFVAELYRRSRLKAAAYDKEQALRESQAALRQQAELLRLSFDAIVVWTMGGGIESWNRGAEELYGFGEKEALGRGIHDLLRTSHAVPWPDFERLLREQGQWDGELRHVTREGREVIVSSRLHMGHGSDGEERVLEIDRDITGQKQVQEELQRAHDELEEKVQQRTADLQKANRMLLMVSACDQALVQMSDERELIAVICQIIQDEGGYPLVWVGLRDGDPGAGVACVASAGDRSGFLDALRARGGESLAVGPAGEAIRTGRRSVVDDLTGVAGDAPWRTEAERRGFRGVAALPLMDAAGLSFGALLIYSDRTPAFEKSQLTLLEELTNDLAFGVMSLRARRERDQAVTALEMKAAQLRMLAGEVVRSEQRERRRIAQLLHDQLQQLLAAALYAVSEVRTASDPAQGKEAAARLGSLLRDSIAMSRSLTSELGHPALAEPDIGVGLEWLAAWMKEKHGLTVTVQSAGALVLPAEEVRITLLQAVRELLFNVVKHAGVREASIVVEARGDNQIRVTVSDKGAGFDAARIAPLGDAGAGTASSGIGLFSIRERLALTGGGIGVESSPGRGSKVTIWVPDDMPPASEESIRLLLVDDHAVVRDGLSLQLRGQQGIVVVGEAADGESAVQLAGSLRPDVVTMDVGMPGMGGVEAARKIHALYPDMAIIGLSMFDDPAQEAAMREAGASAYLTKSASLPTLVAAIRSCRRTSTASSSKH